MNLFYGKIFINEFWGWTDDVTQTKKNNFFFEDHIFGILKYVSEVAILFFLQNDKGDFDYRYLFVQLDDYPRNTIIIEDNRFDNQMDFDKPFDTL